MMNLSMLIFNIMNSLIFVHSNHPLAMTLIIIIQTLIISLSTGIFSLSFWFSYVLFLVFLGGMLVLFIYITSLASNEMFSFPKITLLIVMSMIPTILLMSSSLDASPWSFITWNNDMYPITNSNSITHNDSSYMLSKLYNNPTDLITLMLVNYLFLTLIAIVKITNIFQGPLRQKN
uniref:NADH-ubiquinone oxidoreductase chain 6 n=1 Tax=Hexacentrus japonicus TaxID=441225 RepID=A0A1Q1MP24_9ORTH|nr:NADH dehydrogenase subunit 6 [Hexacentrus japonicus]AQM39834.1 NADH dehydrogenase subunit 6 [Hexacentrus japonicus]